jgi:ubiquinol-cytochrome c reductase cytochrome c subunit
MTKALRCAGLIGVWINAAATGGEAQSGAAIFQEKCSICHSAGSDRIVGPGLGGVLDRRERDWVRRMIMEPDRMLAEQDPIAMQLLDEYQAVMPNFAITGAQADALLEFLASGVGAATPPAPVVVVAASEQQIQLGQDLFQGIARFGNGGPTCNSCHDVTHDAVIGGGILAVELTTVFSRLGGPGVRAIIGAPPFPVMEQAYRGRPLTDEEVVALVGFLERADDEQAFHQPRDYGPKLLAAGVIGASLIFGLFSFAWRGRLRGSVNQSIYDRQIKSI